MESINSRVTYLENEFAKIKEQLNEREVNLTEFAKKELEKSRNENNTVNLENL